MNLLLGILAAMRVVPEPANEPRTMSFSREPKVIKGEIPSLCFFFRLYW
jgi:hypothetical protein